ncbi:hypothetical protein JCM8097_007036 [Rhodosporidiobolus ruineniae]
MLRLLSLSLLAASTLSSALVVPRPEAPSSPSDPSKRGLLNLDLTTGLLGKNGLLGLDLTGSVLKNPHSGSSLLDLDSTLGVLTGGGGGGKKGALLDLDADATVAKNGHTGSALVDADVDATVGSRAALVDLNANAAVASSPSKKSLLGLNLGATVGSLVGGLLDTTATVTAGATDLLGLDIASGNGALIDLDILGTLLGPNQCTGNAVVGVQAELSLGSLLHVCLCVEVLSLGDSDKIACPACPANSDPVCGSGQCACKCKDGYFSDPNHGCLPIATCEASGGHIRRGSDGTSTCECPSPFSSNNDGGCALPPSARARRYARSNPAQPRLDRREQVALVDGDAYKCPDGERACPVGTSGSWECLDVTNELESCGGCPGEPQARDCLSIPGAQNVACVESQCVIASCFPGYRYLTNRCVRTARG